MFLHFEDILFGTVQLTPCCLVSKWTLWATLPRINGRESVEGDPRIISTMEQPQWETAKQTPLLPNWCHYALLSKTGNRKLCTSHNTDLFQGVKWRNKFFIDFGPCSFSIEPGEFNSVSWNNAAINQDTWLEPIWSESRRLTICLAAKLLLSGKPRSKKIKIIGWSFSHQNHNDHCLNMI